MEDPSENQTKITHRHQQLGQEEEGDFINGNTQKKKGGLITMPFIIVNESLEKVASYGLLPNMIMYLMTDYRMSLAKGTNLLFFWSAATNFMPIVGAFVADSFLGRFLTIGFGSIISFLGVVVIWLTTMIPQSKPPPCNPASGNCKSPTGAQYSILVLAYTLMSIGAGGVRPCSQAFGADQVDRRNNPKNERVLETFFNWYYACSCFAVVIALTVIVYIQDHAGWKIGFGVPAALMILSILIFFIASPLYVKMDPRKSLFTSFGQVIVATYRNRNVCLPHLNSNAQFYHKKDSVLSSPSNKLRFLNRACLIRDSEKDICLDGSAKDPWRLTTVEEVEELKSLIRVLPIWSSGLMLTVNTSQNTFQLVQANYMDRHLTSKFEVPAGSFGMFTIIVIVLWIPIYDRLIIPLASKLRGKPVRISVKVRMGIGLFCSFMAMVVSAIVEGTRRSRAVHGNPMMMSAFWLIPQYALHGFAEAFNAIGQTEFYYSEFPKSMSSIATALFGLGMGVASLLASAILSMVDDITKSGGRTSWVATDINKGHCDYYYWLLAVMSFVSMLYYFVCSWAYGPCEGEQRNKVTDEKESADEKN
ncbi:hypothetical protein V2J09_005476 [Rumex salicifolius]